MSRRSLEIAGFVTIAAALHVSAAAMMLPFTPAAGPPLDEPPAALSAGSGDLADLVERWETPPEAQTATAIPAPAQAAEPAPARPASQDPPTLATMRPPDPIAQDPGPTRPRVPQPRARPQPELPAFAPPRIEPQPSLTLDASARPERRPDQPAPQSRRAGRRDTQAPKPQAAPLADQPEPVRQGSGDAGPSARRPAGGGGISTDQRAGLMARWQAQLSSCLLRSIARTSGASGARGSIAFTISRNGRVQGARIDGSTGNRRVDGEIARGARRARCPAAPAGLTEPSYSFVQPFSIR
ncbi:hypothetical protein [Paracoccus salsus]|uniref:hypothetical protein n=1 Tax=Paracoccus salsus TaxID=2911061 RepID=UPI001F477A04|nr:hypothetical protein [Paracoccus salsus]MCF3973348.1 hypothetical protein [Paracoccus salsus]